MATKKGLRKAVRSSAKDTKRSLTNITKNTGKLARLEQIQSNRSKFGYPEPVTELPSKNPTETPGVKTPKYKPTRKKSFKVRELPNLKNRVTFAGQLHEAMRHANELDGLKKQGE